MSNVGPGIDAVELLRDGSWQIPLMKEGNGTILLDSTDIEVAEEGEEGGDDAEFVVMSLPNEEGAGEGGGSDETASTNVVGNGNDIPRGLDQLQNLVRKNRILMRQNSIFKVVQNASQGRDEVALSTSGKWI